MRKALSSILAAGILGLFAQHAAAGQVSVTYKFDVGPMTMTTIQLALDVGPDAVMSKARIKSGGIANLFSEYSAVVEATSMIGGGAPQPVRFNLVRERDNEVRKASLSWTPDGALSYEPQSQNAERRASIAKALNSDVSDPITAVLRIGTAGDTPCPSVHDVFDGRDVFELSLTGKGTGNAGEDVDYRGTVQRCEVAWTPVAGRAKDRNVPPDSYDVSFAPIGKLPSGQQLWLPVDLTGTLKGMPFRAYAQKIKVTD